MALFLLFPPLQEGSEEKSGAKSWCTDGQTKRSIDLAYVSKSRHVTT